MPWIKAWHVIFMVTWFAGLFYLPRLFVYHASATDAAGIERFRVMESRLFVIMTIGAVLTSAFGAWLVALDPGLLQAGWLRAKLVLVALLAGYHRSEDHTSELQSRLHLVCRLLLEKKK